MRRGTRAGMVDPVQDAEEYAQRRAGVRTQRQIEERIDRVSRRGSKTADVYTFSLGPLFVNDLSGSATTQATWMYFNTSTAVSRGTSDQRMFNGGVVVGVFVTSDDARTAGTATARVRINSTGVDFNSGAVVLNATYTTSFGMVVSPNNGVPFSAGDTVGAEIVSSGWTPTTANLRVTLVVQVSPQR